MTKAISMSGFDKSDRFLGFCIKQTEEGNIYIELYSNGKFMVRLSLDALEIVRKYAGKIKEL